VSVDDDDDDHHHHGGHHHFGDDDENDCCGGDGDNDGGGVGGGGENDASCINFLEFLVECALTLCFFLFSFFAASKFQGSNPIGNK
jgi:hypothetical protein